MEPELKEFTIYASINKEQLKNIGTELELSNYALRKFGYFNGLTIKCKMDPLTGVVTEAVIMDKLR